MSDANTWWPAPHGPARVIVPIAATTVEDAQQQARAIAATDADMAEWRADWLAAPPSPQALATAAQGLRQMVAPKPLIVTWRTADEGGRSPDADGGYADIVGAVIGARAADLVDVQVRHPAASALFAAAGAAGVPAIGSWHDVAGTPNRFAIAGALSDAATMGASVAKVAVTAQSADDVVTLLSATNRASAQSPIPLVTVAMGDLGLASRLFGHMYGSQATFATVGPSSAPGQPSLQAVRGAWQTLPKGGSDYDEVMRRWLGD